MLLRTHNLNKHFFHPVEFHVLKDINISVDEGEFVAIVGESGSGKSTLLYILATLDTQYEGELFFKDKALHTYSKKKLAEFRNINMGFVFQFHFLLPEFTVMENVLMPIMRQGQGVINEAREFAQDILERLNIADQSDKRVNMLSGGEQQRVAIARALINRPKLLVADEPTGNLDSMNSGLVMDIFKDITKNAGQTLIVVTHDSNFAKQTDRIIRLKDGEVVQGASPSETRTETLNT